MVGALSQRWKRCATQTGVFPQPLKSRLGAGPRFSATCSGHIYTFGGQESPPHTHSHCAVARLNLVARRRIWSTSSGGSRTSKSTPIKATNTDSVSSEFAPVWRVHVRWSIASSTPAVGGTRSATISTGACKVTRARYAYGAYDTDFET